jgi:hypothetical protein
MVDSASFFRNSWHFKGTDRGQPETAALSARILACVAAPKIMGRRSRPQVQGRILALATQASCHPNLGLEAPASEYTGAERASPRAGKHRHRCCW